MVEPWSGDRGSRSEMREGVAARMLRVPTSALRAPSPRAFTFVELMIGMVITSLVMAALSAVCLATANGWRQGEFTRSGWLSGSGASSQVQRALRDAQYVGYIVSGNVSATPAPRASVFYWRADDFDGDDADTDPDNDGKLQIAEMALIEFDPDTRSLLRYETIACDQMTASQWNSAGLDQSNHLRRSDLVDSATAAEDFKAYLQASGIGVVTVLARNVDAAAFAGLRTDEVTVTARPLVQFELRFSRADADAVLGTAATSIERGTVTLRGPSTRPANF